MYFASATVLMNSSSVHLPLCGVFPEKCIRFKISLIQCWISFMASWPLISSRAGNICDSVIGLTWPSSHHAHLSSCSHSDYCIFKCSPFRCQKYGRNCAPWYDPGGFPAPYQVHRSITLIHCSDGSVCIYTYIYAITLAQVTSLPVYTVFTVPCYWLITFQPHSVLICFSS